jgi:hypothetical protein
MSGRYKIKACCQSADEFEPASGNQISCCDECRHERRFETSANWRNQRPAYFRKWRAANPDYHRRRKQRRAPDMVTA